MRFERPSENPIFSCHNPCGIKLITRLRLGFSHIREHKLRHNFQDTLNLICSCRENSETTNYYLLPFPNYLNLNEKMALLNNLQNVEEHILDRNYSRLPEVLRFGDSSFNDAQNISILNAAIQYIFDTKRFDDSLAVSSTNRVDFILIRLLLFSLFIDFHFV